MYSQIVEQEKVKAAKRRKDQILDNLRAKGILKPKYDAEGKEITFTEAEKAIIEAQEPNTAIPVKMIVGIAAMIFFIFGITATILVVGVKYYSVPSRHVPRD